MQAGDCAVSGAMPESTGCCRMFARGLAVAGLAFAGSVFFAVGTAAANDGDPHDAAVNSHGRSQSEAGLLSLGNVLGDQAGSLLDTAVGRADVPGLAGALGSPEPAAALGLDPLPDLDVLQVTEEPAESDADEAEAAPGDRSNAAAATPERAITADLPDSRDAGGNSATDDRDGAVELSEPGDLAAVLASPVQSEADALRSLSDSLVIATPVLKAATPVLEASAATLAPVVRPLEPAMDTVLFAIAPAIEPIVPVVHALTPALSAAGPVTDVVAPVRDVLAPVSDRLLLDPIAPITSRTVVVSSTPEISHDLTGGARLPAGVDATRPGSATIAAGNTDSLHSLEEPRVVAVDELERERPSQLPMPPAGLTGLSAGAVGGVVSADQTVQSSSALLPEEAVQRARFVSAAAHAAGIDGRSQREATRPSVSPD